MKRIEEESSLAEERKRRDFLEARRRASQLEGMSLTFTERAGEDGKLFGSVTATDVVEKANAGSLDFELDKKTVQLDDPIKATGTVNVGIRLHGDVEVQIEVNVEAEEG
jgi:large subunit ribosomal protein L9